METNTQVQALFEKEGQYLPLITEQELQQLPNEIIKELDEYPLILKTYSMWGQIDSSNTFNTANILRLIENARTTYIIQILSLLPLDEVQGLINGQKNVSFTVRTKLNFLEDTSHPDKYLLVAKCKPINNDKLIFYTKLYSHKNQAFFNESQVILQAVDLATSKSNTFSPNFINAVKYIENNPQSSRKEFNKFLTSKL